MDLEGHIYTVAGQEWLPGIIPLTTAPTHLARTFIVLRMSPTVPRDRRRETMFETDGGKS